MSDPSTQTPNRSSDRLNTTLLMSGSAGFMGLLGVGASLFPRALLSALGIQPESGSVLLMSVAGALYLGFAVLNWMARENPIGGIYSRPVALGNAAHFFATTIVLVKHLVGTPHLVEFAIGTAVYALFAGGFGSLVFAGGDRCG